MIATFKSKLKALVNKLAGSGSLREDWRLIGLVLCFATGILFRLQTDSLSLSSEIWGLVFGAIILFCILIGRNKRVLLYPLAMFALGSASAQFKLEQIPEKTITRETFVQLTGLVQAVEYRTARPTRLTLEVEQTSKEQWLIGRNVRLIVRTEIDSDLAAGHRVSVTTILRQPPGAIVPGGFDFGRHNQFKGIATQGFAVSRVEKQQTEPANGNVKNHIENIRSNLSAKILKSMEQPIGGVAVALITGHRQYMDPKTATDLRDAGLAHLLAISGLHMGLLTGVAFFIFELLFASISAIFLRVTPRKLAAILAWVFALSYLGLSGASTSTTRAFIMVTIAIIAVLADRRVLSLRSIAIAAFAILLISPDALQGIGFQMSFAATIGIVVAYDHLTLWRQQRAAQSSTPNSPNLVRKVIAYFLGAAGTSLIAQLAVGPIALFHFQTFSLVGIAANVIAIPLMAFIVMPSAFLGVLLSTVGLDAPFLTIMEGGLHIIIELAAALGRSPNSVIATMPYGVTLLYSTGIALSMVMIWRSKVILASAISLVVVALLFSKEKPVDVLVAGNGSIIAQLGQAGHLAIVGGRRNGFRDDAWKRYWGLRIQSQFQPIDRSCDSRACQTIVNFQSDGATPVEIPIVVSKSVGTTRQACNSQKIVIASYTHRRYCRGAMLFLASEDIEKYGPVGFWSETTNEKFEITYRWSNPSKNGDKKPL